MRAYVRLGLPDGSSVELSHGDLIGRLWSAALPLADARISEAHAMVSLRGQELRLLALRGRFAVAGEPLSSLTFEEGQRILFAPGLELTVEELHLPPSVFAIEGEGLPRVVVTGVCSLVTRPRPELLPRFRPEAPAHIWSDGETWSLSVDGGTRTLRPGESFVVDGRSFRGVGLPLERASNSATALVGRVGQPLRVLALFDTAHVTSEGGTALALSGLSARLLSEVIAFDGPVPWEVLARELWPDEDDSHLLRRKLDVTLARLRKKLREARIRPDLVRSDGFGHVELFLHDGDEVVDRT